MCYKLINIILEITLKVAKGSKKMSVLKHTFHEK